MHLYTPILRLAPMTLQLYSVATSSDAHPLCSSVVSLQRFDVSTLLAQRLLRGVMWCPLAQRLLRWCHCGGT